MKTVRIIFLFFFFAFTAHAEVSEKTKAKAIEFINYNNPEINKKQLIQLAEIYPLTIEGLSEKERKNLTEKLTTSLAEFAGSSAYKDLIGNAYARVYSEEELAQMIEMIQHPGYKIWKEKYPEVMKIYVPEVQTIAGEIAKKVMEEDAQKDP